MTENREKEKKERENKLLLLITTHTLPSFSQQIHGAVTFRRKLKARWCDAIFDSNGARLRSMASKCTKDYEETKKQIGSTASVLAAYVLAVRGKVAVVAVLGSRHFCSVALIGR